jgi:hypothetical protein
MYFFTTGLKMNLMPKHVVKVKISHLTSCVVGDLFLLLIAKTGHGPHYSTLVVICVVRLLFVLSYVLFVCKCVLPPRDNPTAVTHTHKHTHTHIHTHTYTHTHIQTHTHTHTYIHTYAHTYTHIHTHAYTHTYTHIHIHTYIS